MFPLRARLVHSITEVLNVLSSEIHCVKAYEFMSVRN